MKELILIKSLDITNLELKGKEIKSYYIRRIGNFAYRPDKPFDVLTEKNTGSYIAKKGNKCAIVFDAGNFSSPQ